MRGPRRDYRRGLGRDALRVLIGVAIVASRASVTDASEPPSLLVEPTLGSHQGGEGWRLLDVSNLTRQRSLRALERGLGLRLGVPAEALRVEPTEPARFYASGDRAVLWLDRAEARLTRVDFRGLHGWGRVGLQGLEVDLGLLATGELEFGSTPLVRPELSVDLESLRDELGRRGLEEPELRVSGDGRLEIAGRVPVRMLFLRYRPWLGVEGKLSLDQRRLVFRPVSYRIRHAPGLLRAFLSRAIERTRGTEVARDLVLEGVRLDGGWLELVEQGRGVLRLPLPREEREGRVPQGGGG